MVINNKVMLCWLYMCKYNNYLYKWTFPTSFSTTNYTVQVTHYSNVSTDQTVKINQRTKTYVDLQGNQATMQVTAFACGY